MKYRIVSAVFLIVVLVAVAFFFTEDGPGTASTTGTTSDNVYKIK